MTGAGSGLGLAAAERFAQEGADVAILDLNIGKGTQETERIAKATGRKVVAYQVDVANKAFRPESIRSRRTGILEQSYFPE